MMNKKVKDTIVAILVLLVIGTLIYVVYTHGRNREQRALAQRISALSPRGGLPETIEGLRQAIAIYEEQIENYVRDGAQTGAYWKILAIRLSDRGMHRDALNALERAIHYNADDPTLFFLTGESASVTAASTMDFGSNSSAERERLLTLAETAYLRAIQMDDTYQRPRLSLAILYTFDLDRPSDAIPLMERYLDISPNDINGMFVLARALYMTEQYRRAVDLYDRIITTTRDPQVRNEAQNNREMIMDRIYG